MSTYSPGDRVRTTVDSPAAWPGAYDAPAGTVGTVTHHFPSRHGMGESYGVLLDDDPDGLSASYAPHELAPATETTG